MADEDGLRRYHEKRDFTQTQEPEGRVGNDASHRYLIQKHAATRLHYDFRLELDGVLKSWAVTRGPSLDPADKRLAVEVEDHPVDYGDFEGTIPMGQYGGGTVMLWDRGTWEPVGDPHDGLRKGKLVFKLHGERLSGEWTLVRMHGRPGDKGKTNWLLIKHHDAVAHEGDHDALLSDNATSVVSGRSMEEIAEGSTEWKAGKSRRKMPDTADAQTLKKAKTLKKVGAADTTGPAANHLVFQEPELATLADDMPGGANWVHEVKFDGYRTVALVENSHARMLTRTGLDWTPRFQTLADELGRLGVTDAVLDGEIVALDDKGASSFKTLQDELHLGRSDRLQYYVFDLLRLDGADLTGLPLLERKAKLKALLGGFKSDRILYSEHFSYESDVLEHVCSLAYEGIICKRADAPYASGRNRNWLKVKCHKRQEFVIGGFTEPKTGAPGIGALLLGYYEEEKLVYAGKVGTGFDHDTSLELRQMLEARGQKAMAFDAVAADAKRGARWVRPDVVCEVEFTEWTPDGRLRHPSFQGLREDKPAADVGRDRAVHVTKKMVEAPAETRAEAVVTPEPEPTEKPATKRSSKDGDVGGIRISHPDRVIYPETEITKGDLAAYYYTVRDAILPYAAGRPLSMVRCPEGIGGQCFFQRHIAREQSPYLLDTGIKVKGRNENYLMIKDANGLVTLVQWGAIELHPWGCKADRPDLPDKIIFDLDPDPDVTWTQVVDAVAEVRLRMEEFGLKSFLKTTGGKGLHITVPLTPKYGWPTIKAFARAVAQSMEHDAPQRFIANMSKEKRKGRIFVDYLRNELTSTAIAPYAVRARPGATVATPLSWDELTPALDPKAFTIATVPARLRKIDDPWADYARTDQTLREDYLKALRLPVE